MTLIDPTPSESADRDAVADRNAAELGALADDAVTLVRRWLDESSSVPVDTAAKRLAGVLRDENDDDSVIPHITRADFDALVADGTIQGGMIPKLENSFQAIDAGVSRVIITLASAIDGTQGTVIC